MSERGWIKLHRQLQDNSLWSSEPFSRGQAWVDLLMIANHKQGHVRVRGRRIDVGVGCVARAQKSLADRWNWSKGKVIRFLKELEGDGQIEIETSHDFNVIRLCNYEQFQVNESRSESRDGPPNEAPDRSRDGSRDESRNGPQTGHETGHIQEQQQQQECKEGKKDKGASAKPKFNPPLWMDEQKWKAYLSTRRSKKNPMNPESLELCCKAIDKTVLAGYALDDVMEALIAAGWQTVTPVFMDNWLKNQGRGHEQASTSKQSANARLAEKIALEMDGGALQ